MATAGIILQIGSKFGPGGLSSLQSGIQMIGQMSRAVMDSVKEFDKFSLMYKALEIDISKANDAAKGLIPTMDLLRSANRLTQAGVKATAEEMEMLAKITVMASKTTGEDMTVALNGFVNALSGGGTEFVRKFGMQIKETGTASEKMSEFMKVATERTEGFNVEIETLTEGVGATKENFGTLIDMLMLTATNADGTSGAFNGLNSIMSDAIKELDELEQSGAPGWLDDFQSSVFGVSIALADFILWTNEAIRSLGLFKLGTAMADASGAQAVLAKVKNWKTAMEASRLQTELAHEAAGVATYGPTSEQLGITGGKKKGGGKKGKGKGAKKKDEFDMEFSESETSKDVALAETDLIKGTLTGDSAYVDPYGRVWASVDEAIDARTQEAEMMFAAEDAMLATAKELHIEDARNMLDEEGGDLELQAEIYARQQQAQEQHHAMMLGIEQSYLDASYDAWNANSENKLMVMQSMVGTWGQLMNAADGISEKAFNIGKVAAIGEVWISAALAVMKTWQAYAGIAFAGPVIAGIQSAGIIALAGFQTAAISQREYRGGGGGASVSKAPGLGGGGGGASTFGAGGGYGTGGGGGVTHIHLDLDGEQIHEVMVGQNDKADQQGRRSFKAA